MNLREEGNWAVWSPIKAKYKPMNTKRFLEDSVVLKRVVFVSFLYPRSQ